MEQQMSSIVNCTMLASPRVTRAAQQSQLDSPIGRIPPELLRRIFIEIFRAPDVKLFDHFPLVLSWVCGHWREVALSISALWSTIPLVFPRPYAIPLVEAYLARSNVHQLDIFTVPIDDRVAMRADDEATVGSSLMQLLLPHIGRWKTLILWPEHPSTVQRMLSLTSGTADCLEHLELSSDCVCCPHNDMNAATYIIPPSFLAPRIFSVKINRYPHGWLGVDSFGHVTSMDTLRIEGCDEREKLTLPTVVPLLGSFERLRHLTFASIFDCSPLQVDKSLAVCLPHLEHVTWLCVSAESIAKFFSVVKAPELKSLRFWNVCSISDPYALPSTLRWLSDCGIFRSRFPKLHHVEIDRCSVELGIVILAGSFITSLTLHICELADEDEASDSAILVAMGKCHGRDGWWMCPTLESLRVIGGEADTEIAALRRMVEARLVANSSASLRKPAVIKSLHISCLAIMEEDRVWFSGHVQEFTFEANVQYAYA